MNLAGLVTSRHRLEGFSRMLSRRHFIIAEDLPIRDSKYGPAASGPGMMREGQLAQMLGQEVVCGTVCRFGRRSLLRGRTVLGRSNAQTSH